jgi:hypothetical protein
MPNNYTFDMMRLPEDTPIMAPEVIDFNLEGAIMPFQNSTTGNNISVLTKDPQGKTLFSLKLTDSPFIDIPKASCDKIATAFNLSYDSNTSRYLISNDVHRKLSASKAALTISFADSRNPSSRPLVIRLDYPALHYMDGGPNGTGQRYMPIRASISNPVINQLLLEVTGVSVSMYRLGRAFYQETYVIADYEKNVYYMHQVDWRTPSDVTHIVPLTDAPRFDLEDSSAPPNRITKTTTKIIITVVCSMALLSLLAVVLFWHKRRRKKSASAKTQPSAASSIPSMEPNRSNGIQTTELDNSHRSIGGELGNTMLPSELSSGRRTEISGISQPQALDSRPLFEMDGIARVCQKEPISGLISSRTREALLYSVTPASPIPETPAEYYGLKQDKRQQRVEEQARVLKEPRRRTQSDRRSV